MRGTHEVEGKVRPEERERLRQITGEAGDFWVVGKVFFGAFGEGFW